MGRQGKTTALIEAARGVLETEHPMTLRQVFYRLISRQVLENSRAAYQGLSNALVNARKEGHIPWEWLEDRLRRPRNVGMWNDLGDFAETAVRAYRRDVWPTQGMYLEVWLEKDALSGIFEDVLRPYGVTLNVGRGYDGWDSIHNAAQRYGDGQRVTVLYFGDFDPSGDDMVRSLRERLAFFECRPEVIKCALVPGDVERYHLPPNLTKSSDTCRARFVKEHGDMAVELDALPPDVLRERLKGEVEKRMDLAALREVRGLEQQERVYIRDALGGAQEEGELVWRRCSSRAWDMPDL